MSLTIAGMGWVTPLGCGVDQVWERLVRGDESSAKKIEEQFGGAPCSVFRVPESALSNLAPHPRLRRASAISRFAASAGLEAIEDAGIKLHPENAKRVALIFAISNGGVIYTKRFYREIVATGAQAASPLLFPETVFNAPASHLAAILGITGTTYTLVGDGAVGLLAVRMAEDLMANPELDYCVVVGSEEVDWLLGDAYRKWRLVRPDPPIEPFRATPRGTILSEGAGAVVLGRTGGTISVQKTHAGCFYKKRTEVDALAKQMVNDLADVVPEFVISSANGTFIDQAESRAVTEAIPHATIYSGKAALGEGVGASGLWQVILGAKSLRHGRLPPQLHGPAKAGLRLAGTSSAQTNAQTALVLTCGLNQQMSGLRLGLPKASV